MKFFYKNWNIFSKIIIVLVLFFVVTTMGTVYNADLSSLKSEVVVSISMDTLGVIISAILFFSGWLEKRHFNLETALMIAISFLECAILTADIFGWVWDQHPHMYPYLVTSNFLMYLSFILMLIFYWYFVLVTLEIPKEKNKRFNIIFYSIAIIAMLMVAGNLFLGYYYTIDPITALYQRGTYFEVSTYMATILFGLIVYKIIRTKTGGKTRYKLLEYIVLPIIFNIVQNFTFGYSLLYVAILISLILLYMNIHLQRGVEIARKNEELSNKEREIQQYQTDIMITCIQPHFLFNSLGAISMLIRLDPDLAATATDKFSKYLRANLDSISNNQPIPLKKELEHIENYLYLEKVRFEDVEFDMSHIENADFEIPAITVQPLVENAIKHGIMAIEDGGKVSVSEYEYEDHHMIIVEDNGIGFDYLNYKNDGKPHVGLDNVKSRLETMINGKLIIESEIGKGTKAIIKIPK